MYIAQLVSLNSFTTKIIIKNKKIVKNERKKKCEWMISVGKIKLIKLIIF